MRSTLVSLLVAMTGLFQPHFAQGQVLWVEGFSYPYKNPSDSLPKPAPAPQGGDSIPTSQQSPSPSPTSTPTPTPKPDPTPSDESKCRSKIQSLNVRDGIVISECNGWSEFKRFVLTTDFDACYAQTKALGEGNLVAFDLCNSWYKARDTIELLKSPTIQNCHKTMQENGITDLTLQLCERFKPEFKALPYPDQFKTCLKSSVEAMGNYFKMDVASRLQHNNSLHREPDNSAFFYLVDNCLKDNSAPRPRTDPLKPSVLMEYVFHHTQEIKLPQGGSNVPLGGISGCSYVDQEKLLYCVTDRKNDPAVYVFDLNSNTGKWQLKFNRYIPLASFSPTEEKKPEKSTYTSNGVTYIRYNNSGSNYNSTPKISPDFEDLFITRDHRIFLSSELGDNSLAAKQLETNAIYEYSYDGSFKAKSPVAAEFLPTWDQKSNTVTRQEQVRHPPHDHVNNRDDFYTRDAFGYWYHNFKDTVTETYQSLGTKYNKGLEAFTMDPTEEHFYYANEGTLVQDSGEFGIRIARAEVSDPSKTAQYEYYLENEVDNGMSAILAIDTHHVITLERSYDFNRKKVTARIFNVTLFDSNEPTLLGTSQKQEILNLKDLSPFMVPGFRKIDNYEAMTMGPSVDDQSITLVLATDDNFQFPQQTQFLLVRVPKTLIFGH